jgi:release factor glutamine methyltransferase
MNEAEVLFSEVLNCDRPSLYLNRKFTLDRAKSSFISSVLKRRMRGEPLQYILGKSDFMGLEFKVSTSVLIPRQETEILVEKVIDIVRSSECGVRSILDVGTGSGCIAISLAKLLPGVKIDAVDISKEALETAERNAKLHNVIINFRQSDLLSACGSAFESYDLIISNPPYIPTAEIDTLQPEIAYEPRVSLDGGKDGLDFYRRIIAEAGSYLKKNGLLILEMGARQASAIRDMLGQVVIFKTIEIIQDYNNIERVIVARKEG